MEEQAIDSAPAVLVNWSGRTPPANAAEWVGIIERIYGPSYGIVRLQPADADAWRVKRATSRLNQPPNVNDVYPQDFSKKAAVIMALWNARLPVELG
jgi:hypothetical protein